MPAHAAGHHYEQLAAGEACQIRPDEQRRLDHAEKDVGRGREPDRAADLERALEQRGQHAHHQHDRQGLQRQHEFRPGHLELVGKLPAAEIAETKEVPALLAAAMASTASLIAANARVAPGTLSRIIAVTKVTSSATAACIQATPRRSSLTTQAMASRAKMPNADWRFCIAPLRQARA